MHLHKRYIPDIAGIALILITLALLTTSVLTFSSTPERARGATVNQTAAGASRFAGWLQGRGYQLRLLDTPESTPLTEDNVLFILAPRSSYTWLQLARLDAWVQNGGTLVIAQENRQPVELPRQFGVAIGRLWLPARYSGLQLPALNWPPVGQAAIGATHFVKMDCGRAAVHMGSCQTLLPGNKPLFVAFGRGRGQVFLVSSATPFTNKGLQDGGNAQLVENLVLAIAAPGQRIAFDEAHYQIPATWLFTAPTGWALGLSLLALLGFFIWRQYTPGSQTPPKRRSSEAEADTAVGINHLAGAEQQFGRYEALANHYWQRLKRTLARRYGLDSALSDKEFVEMLKPHLASAEMGVIVYLLTQKANVPLMAQAELRQWVSAAIELSDRQPLTRELHEYQKTI